MPVSFRARLTLSYTVLTALLLTVALCVLAGLVVERTIATSMTAVDETAATVRTIVRTHWLLGDRRIAALVVSQAQRAGVRLIVAPRGPGGPFGEPHGPPPGGERAGLPPMPDRSGPPPADDRGGPFAPRPWWGLASTLGAQPRFVPLPGGAIAIVPDEGLQDAFVLYGVAFGIAELLTILASWAIGRAITQQAIRPLATVTAELRRFAGGDFAPSRLETADRSELGDLVAAYNGAAAQVVSAFSERERTERHLRRFLGEAGHEMRTPMTVISAYLELLAATVSPEAIMSPETLSGARTQMRRLRDLVERVMALARMQGSDSSNAELIDVIETAQEAIAGVTAARGGTVRLTHDADDVVVRAEPWELQEAIGNLVDNALAYGAGSPVDVTVATVDEHVVVRVRDGGPGIGEDEREHLFQHFFRGAAAGGTRGSGLGLAIVARAAERLGGRVRLEPGPRGDGTTFRLEIPVYRHERRAASTVRVG